MTDVASTIPLAFADRVQRTPGNVAYRERQNSSWRDITWAEVGQRVAKRRAAFAAAGLPPGSRVAILLPNSVEWIVTDLAAMAQGLVTVPVYTRDSASNIHHVLRDCGAAICVTDTSDRWTALGAESGRLPDLRKVWILDKSTATDGYLLCHLPDGDDGEGIPELASDGSQLATIIYTSGTTGPPKGVMLAHTGLLWNAECVSQVNQIRQDDRFLSILPLAHAFERTLGWLCPMLNGSTVCYPQSIETLPEDLESQRPTILLAVPRLFERIHSAALEQAGGTAFARWMLNRCVEVGWRRHLASDGSVRPPALIDRWFWALAGRRIAARVRDKLGGRLRMAISGGAPLSEETQEFMMAMEVPLIEGYGLTEAGPAVTGSTLADRRAGFVGKALPGAEVKIGKNDELLVRSPGVMMGYWHNPVATNEAIDSDGWLRTGDLAAIIDGRVQILGRMKDILVLSTGENVNPAPIETALLADPLIEQACVLGDNKPWCSAVVVVNKPRFRDWADQVLPGGVEDVNDTRVRLALTEHLAHRLQEIPPFARIRSVIIETAPWTLDSGLITPTLKAKRPKISDRYSCEIIDLYR